MLTIGDLSQRTGVKVATIRFYEKIGLLDAATRSLGNQRRYTPQEQERLSFIKHGRDLGLTIEAIRKLLELSAYPERPCKQADRIAREQLQDVREKIEQLRRLEAELTRLASGCDGDQIKNCQVIRALADVSRSDKDPISQ